MRLQCQKRKSHCPVQSWRTDPTRHTELDYFGPSPTLRGSLGQSVTVSTNPEVSQIVLIYHIFIPKYIPGKGKITQRDNDEFVSM